MMQKYSHTHNIPLSITRHDGLNNVQGTPGALQPMHRRALKSRQSIDLDRYTYPQNVAGALKLLEEAVSGESEDRMFYQYLMDNAPSKEDKDIIKGIQEDEMNHFKLFREVYKQITGDTLPPPKDVTFEKPASYCEGLKWAIWGEQNAVRKYRRIMYALDERMLLNVLVEIITDELRHGILYNFLYSKNGCLE